MDLMLIVFFLIIIFAVLLVFSILKKLVKAAIIIAIIFIVIFLITGGTIINDFKEVKSRIASEPAKVFLQDGGNLIMGFIVHDSYDVLSEDELSLANSLYESRLDELQGESYKVFIISSDIFEGMSLEINNKEVTGLKEILTTDRSPEYITKEDMLLDIDIIGDPGKDDMLFAYAYEKKIKITKNPLFFFKNYKEGIIEVYPESMFFRFTKFIPLAWIDQKLDDLKDSVAEQTKKVIS